MRATLSGIPRRIAGRKDAEHAQRPGGRSILGLAPLGRLVDAALRLALDLHRLLGHVEAAAQAAGQPAARRERGQAVERPRQLEARLAPHVGEQPRRVALAHASLAHDLAHGGGRQVDECRDLVDAEALHRRGVAVGVDAVSHAKVLPHEGGERLPSGRRRVDHAILLQLERRHRALHVRLQVSVGRALVRFHSVADVEQVLEGLVVRALAVLALRRPVHHAAWRRGPPPRGGWAAMLVGSVRRLLLHTMRRASRRARLAVGGRFGLEAKGVEARGRVAARGRDDRRGRR
mmetsp:Transcript_84047/g.251957  ORF Transcript_84047/g.251957 Transcript_84047/m.251957 type:complete len:290 (-) Transcript_84047:768-1637(-)